MVAGSNPAGPTIEVNMAGNKTSSLGKRGYRKRGPKTSDGTRRKDKKEVEGTGDKAQELRRYRVRYS